MNQNPFEELFAAAVAAGIAGKALPPIPVGRTVVCDSCSEVMTDDSRPGGFTFDGFGGIWAVGPCCAVMEEARMRARGGARLIRERCPAGMPFADWVRAMRGPAAAIAVTPATSRGGAR